MQLTIVFITDGEHLCEQVKFELPKHFQKKMRDEIIAGAANINLKEFSFYFFEVGLKMAESMEDPVSITTTLTSTSM